jgi:hypothetical protein
MDFTALHFAAQESSLASLRALLDAKVRIVVERKKEN